MSSISSTSILQSLLQKDTATSGSSTSSSNQSLTQILAAAQGTDVTGDTSSSGDSYLLDLSAEAQAYLTSMSANGSTTSQNSATSSNGSGIVLSPVQQDKLNAILVKYKDAPYTDATFQQIQQDMSAAGIGADALAAQNQMRHVNPTAMLLDALNGGDGSVGTAGGSADIAASEKAFMSQVNDQWKRISSDYDATTDGSKTADDTAGGTSATDA